MAIRKQDLIPAHNMVRSKKNEKDKDRTIEFRVEVDGIVAVATSGKHSIDFNRILERWEAESFVFMPLAEPGKHLRRLFKKPTAMTRKKASLPAGEWYAGDLQHEHNTRQIEDVVKRKVGCRFF